MARKFLGREMNPLTKRRLKNFKANKRGYWSLWMFLALFTISLFAELVANDRPIFVRYEGKNYFPALVVYPETEFGGDFVTATDYRDPFIAQKLNERGAVYWPLIRYSYGTIDFELKEPAPSRPSREHWFGTDDHGRDVAARLIYGFRISVLFGLILAGLGSAAGIAIGAIQGYFGGLVDLLGQRAIEIWSGFPMLYLLIIFSSIIEPSFWMLLGIMLLFGWMSLVGVVRAEFLRGRKLDYVIAARALGASEFSIIAKHVLPNAMISTLTFLPFVISGSIVTLTSLDFLGFGLPPGSPSLGELLSQGKANLAAPWLGISGFVTLGTMLSLLVFIGEAVRDAFDPRKAF